MQQQEALMSLGLLPPHHRKLLRRSCFIFQLRNERWTRTKTLRPVEKKTLPVWLKVHFALILLLRSAFLSPPSFSQGCQQSHRISCWQCAASFTCPCATTNKKRETMATTVQVINVVQSLSHVRGACGCWVYWRYHCTLYSIQQKWLHLCLLSPNVKATVCFFCFSFTRNTL